MTGREVVGGFRLGFRGLHDDNVETRMGIHTRSRVSVSFRFFPFISYQIFSVINEP